MPCMLHVHVQCLLVKNLRTLAILWLYILPILSPPSVIAAGQLWQPHQHKQLCMSWSAALTTIPYPCSQAVGETAWQVLQVQTVYECTVMAIAISHSSSKYQISARDTIFPIVRTWLHRGYWEITIEMEWAWLRHFNAWFTVVMWWCLIRYCQLSGGGSNSLNLWKLPGKFSYSLGTRLTIPWRSLYVFLKCTYGISLMGGKATSTQF